MKLLQHQELDEIESTFGLPYPASFRARLSEMVALSKETQFREHFPKWSFMFTLAEVTEALTSDIDESYLPFAREVQNKWCDYYCFDQTDDAQEPKVVMFAEDAVVADWETLDLFLLWVREQIAMSV